MTSLTRPDAHATGELVSTKSVPAMPATKRIRSQDLLEQMREVEIDHEGRVYRLRLTQFNRLILTA